MHNVQGLQGGQIAPGPGTLHPDRIVEVVARERQMEVIGAESVVG